MKNFPRLFLIMFALSAVSCATFQRPQARKQVKHIVVMWLNQPGDESARQEIIRVSESFKKIDGVLDVHVGTVVPSTRPVVDSSYDVALVMTFRDEAALNAYLPHPVHQEALTRVIKPLVKRFIVYDFTVHDQ